MSNGGQRGLVWKQLVMIGKFILDGKRDPADVAHKLQWSFGIPGMANDTTPDVYDRLAIAYDHLLSLVVSSPMTGPNIIHLLQSIIKQQMDKFALLIDLGIITVPEWYNHPTYLTTFLKSDRKKLLSVNYEITDVNFSDPSRILKPGDKLWVRAFQQVVGDKTNSEECMTFLATQNGVHPGAQGAALVFEQKRDKLPTGKRYASFDKNKQLQGYAVARRKVPRLIAHSGGGFNFFLDSFDSVWRDKDAFLCFNEVE